MAERYKPTIQKYCETNGIRIPPGFKRGAACRYAVIQMTKPPQLVARTWFSQTDVIYFLNNIADETPVKLLDFKDLDELSYEGGSKLKRIGKFEL